MQPSRRSQIPMLIAAASRSPAESATTRCSGSCAGKGGWALRLQGGRGTDGARFKLFCGRLATPWQQLLQVVVQALHRGKPSTLHRSRNYSAKPSSGTTPHKQPPFPPLRLSSALLALHHSPLPQLRL